MGTTRQWRSVKKLPLSFDARVEKAAVPPRSLIVNQPNRIQQEPYAVPMKSWRRKIFKAAANSGELNDGLANPSRATGISDSSELQTDDLSSIRNQLLWVTC